MFKESPQRPDKRKRHRLDVHIACDCTCASFFFQATILNLNSIGMCIETGKKLAVEDEIKVILELPPKISVQTSVRWMKKTGLHYHYGLQIIQLDTESEGHLMAFLQQRLWGDFKR